MASSRGKVGHHRGRQCKIYTNQQHFSTVVCISICASKHLVLLSCEAAARLHHLCLEPFNDLCFLQLHCLACLACLCTHLLLGRRFELPLFSFHSCRPLAFTVFGCFNLGGLHLLLKLFLEPCSLLGGSSLNFGQLNNNNNQLLHLLADAQRTCAFESLAERSIFSLISLDSFSLPLSNLR